MERIWGKIISLEGWGNVSEGSVHFDSQRYVDSMEKVYSRIKANPDRDSEISKCVDELLVYSDKISVLDIGGRWGDHFHSLSDDAQSRVAYSVLETPNNTFRGRQKHPISSPVEFIDDIENAQKKYDLVFSSSCFPVYFFNWQAISKKIIDMNPKIILIDKCLMSSDVPSFLIEQLTPEGPIAHFVPNVADMVKVLNGYVVEMYKPTGKKLKQEEYWCPTSSEEGWGYKTLKLVKR